MPIGIQGSFNLCDVRDLAAGCIAAVDKGRIGEAYILANEPVTLKEMCEMLHEECNCQKIKFYLPLNIAGKIAQTMEKKAEKTGEKPMMTTFSVYNLARNNEFDYNHLCGFVLQNLKGGIISSYEEITDIFNPIMCMPWCKSPTGDIAY